MTIHEKRLYKLLVAQTIISLILFYLLFTAQENTWEAIDIYGRSIIELYELIVDMPKTSL